VSEVLGDVSDPGIATVATVLAGLRVQLYAAGELDAATRTELRALSDEWLAAKGGAEMGFTMGRLSPQGYPSTGAWVAVARAGRCCGRCCWCGIPG
jgi:lysylphosphatidylglycerol synthetase-like protein (DUF2156 family)